jgi:hypothetical protein
MSIIRNKAVRKTVIRGDRSFNLETFEVIVISDEIYQTNGETLLIVKDVAQSKVKLDSTTTERVKIKTLTNCVIIPDIGRIDEEWDEISVGKGACVELQNVNGVWYILSSDGVKMD